MGAPLEPWDTEERLLPSPGWVATASGGEWLVRVALLVGSVSILSPLLVRLVTTVTVPDWLVLVVGWLSSVWVAVASMVGFGFWFMCGGMRVELVVL